MIWKGWSERAALATGNFARLFERADIPPLPELSTRILAMCRDPGVDVAELSRLIASDIGLSAKLLATVNSACYGLRRKVASVSHAISMLGLDRVGALVTAFLVSRQLPTRASGFDSIAFWQHSIQRATFAQIVAAEIAPDTEAEAFTGALLQDMALPILLSRWATHYRPTYQLATSAGRPLHEIEEEQLTWNHAQAGAWMARKWCLPDVLVCCVGLHHATMAELTALELDHPPVAAAAASTLVPDAELLCRDVLGWTAQQYEQICQKTNAACREMATVFRIPAPRPIGEPVAAVRLEEVL